MEMNSGFENYEITPKGYLPVFKAVREINPIEKINSKLTRTNSIYDSTTETIFIEAKQIEEHLENGYKVTYGNIELNLPDCLEIEKLEIYSTDLSNSDKCARQSGKSTRLMDNYIQDLFNGKTIEVRDHLDHPGAHTELYEKILKRLRNEHYLISDDFEINNRNLLMLKLTLKTLFKLED